MEAFCRCEQTWERLTRDMMLVVWPRWPWVDRRSRALEASRPVFVSRVRRITVMTIRPSWSSWSTDRTVKRVLAPCRVLLPDLRHPKRPSTFFGGAKQQERRSDVEA